MSALASVDEQVDTSDLDLLDQDDVQHTYCTFCFPALKPLDVVTAACGQRVVVMPGLPRGHRCLPCHLAFLAQFCTVCRRSRW